MNDPHTPDRPAPLPAVMIEPLVRAALLEDLGRGGDLTGDSTIPLDATAAVALVPRQPGRIAGLDLALLAFRLLDPEINVSVLQMDGDVAEPGRPIARLEGRARPILAAERVALNFLGHLSGIASVTGQIVDAVAPHGARVCCTRKTTPGLRAVEKYAVRAGGGANHRFGLDDGVLIKDNHLAIAGGVTAAVTRARRHLGHMVKIEVEVDRLDQLEEALGLQVDAVLLDNMPIDTLRQAVRLVGGRCITEASGRITPDSAAAIAACGVDLVSVGWITHSAPCLDIGLDFAGPSMP